ncbi:MAG: hypothetical protein Q8O13_01660 [Candidatus Omnitrophota bacterium]|nr:hypothetical protein [Candidatus Omnitrophota bacterium]
MNKKPSNIFLIVSISFVIIFILAIISVNNWLKQALKEETAVQEKLSVPAVSKSKYKQPSIKPQTGRAVAEDKEKKAATSETTETGFKEIETSVPQTEKVLMN